jgi:hypothetical protein
MIIKIELGISGVDISLMLFDDSFLAENII